MKILSVEQIRQADKYTIEHEPITSIDLMERAAQACVDWIKQRFDADHTFKIICGLGNNGGDGLAIARLLLDCSYNVKVFIINYSDKRSKDFKINYERLKSKTGLIEIDSLSSFQNHFSLEKKSILIDAIIGSGLKEPVQGMLADVITFINEQSLPVIAIDIPSGLYADKLNKKDDIIVNADHTLTFQFPKLSFMYVENAERVSDLHVLNIGLSMDYINTANTKNHFVTEYTIRPFLKRRNKSAHKGNFGHVLIIAGSYGKIGAAVLSGKACLRSGVGLLTMHIPQCGYEILQSTVPEAMVDSDSESNFIADNLKIEKYNAIGIGPGIGMEKQTQNILKLLIQNSVLPIVFDADAINILSENKTWLSFLPPYCIFTPHVKEFERLVGKANSSEERLQQQIDFSFKYNSYVVLKGNHTSVSCPDGYVFFNSTGNPGMAMGGSGDVLTGIITSLLAQGYTSQQACILGVYLHGLAGDFAAEEKTQESMIASDIIESLGNAFRYLHQ